MNGAATLDGHCRRRRRRATRRFISTRAMTAILLLLFMALHHFSNGPYHDTMRRSLETMTFSTITFEQKISSSSSSLSSSVFSSSSSSSSSSSESFLIYKNHDGWSNQLMALQHAAQLAYALNRTLVVPPVLPHIGDVAQRYRHWEARENGGKCEGYLQFRQQQEEARDMARIAEAANQEQDEEKHDENGSNPNFPSFQSVLQLDVLTQKWGCLSLT
jgi:hypothetical protein